LKTIIAGSRDIYDARIIISAIMESGFDITEVVSGTCHGVDRVGEHYAKLKGIPIKRMPAEWSDVKVKGAIIKINKYNHKYNVAAGPQRNAKMAEYADALIAIWDGKSKGTQGMIRLAQDKGLKVFIKEV